VPDLTEQSSHILMREVGLAESLCKPKALCHAIVVDVGAEKRSPQYRAAMAGPDDSAVNRIQQIVHSLLWPVGPQVPLRVKNSYS
jgi:hypothetical protein